LSRSLYCGVTSVTFVKKIIGFVMLTRSCVHLDFVLEILLSLIFNDRWHCYCNSLINCLFIDCLFMSITQTPAVCVCVCVCVTVCLFVSLCVCLCQRVLLLFVCTCELCRFFRFVHGRESKSCSQKRTGSRGWTIV